MKTFRIAVLALLVATCCDGADLSFGEQVIALPQLTLSRPNVLSSSPQAIPKEVQRLADAEFLRRFGLCGMIQFLIRDGDAWIFSTKIGYGGVAGPNITVIFRAPNQESQKPNQTLEPTAPSGRGSS